MITTMDNSNIQGNLRISSGINSSDTGDGSLLTDTIQENTASSGVSLLSDVFVDNTNSTGAKLTFVNNLDETAVLQMNSSTNSSGAGVSTFNLTSNTVALRNNSSKGLTIQPTTGDITVDSTTDSIDDSTGSVILNGGLLVKKSMNVKDEIHGLDGIHEFVNTSFGDNVVDVQNTNIGGYSSLNFKDNSGSIKLRVGYGNSTVSSPLNSAAFVQSSNGSSLLLRANDTDTIKLNTDATIDMYNTTASTSASSGGLRIYGGLGIINTTDAVSSTNGGSLTAAGGVAIAKKLFVGSDTYINGILDMNNNQIINLSSPVSANDAVNKGYLDNTIDDLRIKKNVRVASTVALTLSTDFEAGDTIDGVVLVQGDRILIKNQSSGVENGIYIVNASGAPSRAPDMPAGSSAASIFTIVQQGTLNADTLWICANNTGSDTVNTDSLVFVQIQGGGGGGTYFAGTGLTLTGDTFSVNASQTQITGLGTISTGTWNASTITVPYGGTGDTSFTATGVLLGNGTSAIYAGTGITYATSTLTLPKIISNDTTATTTSATGSILVSGGIGISNTTDAVSATNGGTITTAGGVAIAKKLFVGTDLSIGGNVVSGTWNGSTITVPYGGTGATTLTSTGVLVGNGTGAVSAGSGITYATSTLTLPKIISNDSTATTSLSTGAVLLSGGLGISNTTDAVSATNGGTITTAGGVAIAKKLFVGTDLSIGGNVVSGTWNGSTITVPYGGTGATTLTSTGVLVGNGTGAVSAGSGITYATSTLTLPKIISNDSTATTSMSTGAVLLSGGLGISNTTDATSSTNGGTITTAGGVAIAKKLFVGTDLSIGGNVVSGVWTASTINVPYGGTGDTSFTATGVLLGNGTSAIYAGTGITYATSTLTLPKIISNDSTATTSSITGAVLLSGGLGISNTTDAVSATNGGTITTAGGVAIAKKLFVGTDLSVGGNVVSGVWTASTITVPYGGTGDTSFTATGVLLGNGTSAIYAGTGITYATSTLTLPKIISNDSTATTSLSTGSILVSGGIGISNTTDAVSATNGGTITTAGGVAIAKKLFVGSSADFGSFIDISSISPPSNPSSGYSRLYVDNSDGFLKRKNSSGVVKTYNPNTSKGDIMTHDGTNDIRLPVGTLNQVLFSDSTLSSGVGWRDLSTETAATNPESSKYFEAYVSANQTLSGTYEDILFESTRTVSTDVFTRVGSSTIRFEASGTYIVMARLSIDISSGSSNIEASMKLILDNDDDTYIDIPGTTSYCNCTSGSFPTGNMSTFCILTPTENQKLKVQCRRDTGTSTIQTLPNACNIIIFKAGIDLSDNSKYFNIYSNTTSTLSGTFADIPIGVTRLTDSPYGFTNGTAPVSILENGKYIITYGVGCDKTSGTDRSISESRLMLSDSNGLNFAQVDGSLIYTYHFTNGYSASSSNYSCLQLVSGQILKIQSRIYSGSNLRTGSGLTHFGAVKLQSTTSGQSTPKFLNISNTGNVSITNSYTDLTFDTNDLVDTVYSHVVSSEEIDILEEGKYIIMLSFSGEITTSTDSVSQIRFQVDNGDGYTEIEASKSGAYHYNATINRNSSTSFFTLNMSSTSKIKAQAIRSYGTQTMRSVANGINLSLVKLDGVEEPVNSLIKFGTFYRYNESLGNTSTTSTTYIDKLTLTTDVILDGYYRIGIFYTCAMTSNNGSMSVLVLEDNSITVFENTFVISSNNVDDTSPFYSPKEVYLTAGIHNFKIQFKSVSGTANIRDAKIEFWRVK